MTTLRGHARPVRIEFLTFILDHTYVTCAAGHAWPCWGDATDGVVIVTGEGSSAQADCLSQPSSQAGIQYGITGLCHQTSNRILWPAGITVSDSNGYGITEFFYGTYGPNATDWITHRDGCSNVIGEIGECTGAESPEADPPGSKKDALLSFLVGLYEQLTGEDEEADPPPPNLALLSQILEARVRHVLGDEADRVIERMQVIQQESVRAKTRLDLNLRRREISGRDFAEQANRLINRALLRIAETVDSDAYVALFQLRPRAEITVVRPDICAAVYD